MNICSEGQLTLTFDNDISISEPTKKTYPEIVFDFNSLFNTQLTEENMNNNNSMAILGDSLSVLKKMIDKSVQLIFADAPYNIGKDFGNNSDKWDSVHAYIEWCKTWIDECMRVLSDNGTMYFMTATQHMPYLDVFASEKYNVLCRIIWSYDSSGVQSKKMYGSLYEPILMISKTSKASYTFNYEDIVIKTKQSKKSVLDELERYIEQRSSGMIVLEERYHKAIEEIITINELQMWTSELNNNDIDGIIRDIDIYYKLEMNIDAEDEEN